MNQEVRVIRASSIAALVFILSLPLTGCKTTVTGPTITSNVQLSAEHVGCTEVWLKIVYSGQSSTIRDFKITRDGDTVLAGRFSGTDTVVIDTTAQAERIYTYRGYRFVNSQVSDTSLPLQVTTPDSTSHNWQFQTFTFGDVSYSSSILRDVAVINDTLAYAVGEIYLADSITGKPDPLPYNLAIWNGKEWNLKKVAVSFRENTITPPLFGVFSFSSDNVWLIGDPLVFGDGKTWSSFDYRTLTGYDSLLLTNGWGVNPTGLYFGGLDGSIVSYSSGSWKRLLSGTTLNLDDIWGSPDGSTVYAAGDNLQTGESILLINRGSNWETMYHITSSDPRWSARYPDTLCGEVPSIWTNSSKDLWSTTTTAVYHTVFIDGKGYDRISWAPEYLIGFTWRIRGQAENDIFVVGDYNTLAHWNGSTWMDFTPLFGWVSRSSTLRSVSVRNNLVVAVGEVNGQAEIILGRQ